jgi:ubiquinone biosynthesis UbiH/UbiF/VisC/COQ6 family hydroxylase
VVRAQSRHALRIELVHMKTQKFDMIIVGGGLVGASLALALHAADLSIAVIEPEPPATTGTEGVPDSRVYAISPGSADFLSACGIWQALPQERLARVEAMRIFGDDDSSRLDFSAYDAGLGELAFIVENNLLQRSAWRRLQSARHVQLFSPARCADVRWNPDHAALTLEDGTELSARLLVGADGAGSWVRTEAGIVAKLRDYGQLGIVANFAASNPHQEIAYQWFRRDGVLALLPLADNQVSMVWSVAESRARELLALTPRELAHEVGIASRQALGELRAATPPAAFPLRMQHIENIVKSRIALVGDAAHSVHPLAGQGVNLGFRDARELARVLGERGAQSDCGDYALLRRYERARKQDILAMQFMTDALQKLFNNDVVWLARVRNLGLRLVSWQPQLKNLLVRQAVA